MGIDLKLIDEILTEEKRNLKIPLLHILEPFKDKIIIGLERSSVHIVRVEEKQIKLRFNENKNY